ncbi:MAG: hypothetical protein HWN68_13235 [Desulfobacterales bacterium]|nr:hypothetical protein [Desulfobacterales bacterium]
MNETPKKKPSRTTLVRDAVLLALGIPEKNSEVVPVKMGPNLKEALKLVSGGNVSGWVRDAVKRELKRRFRL